MEIDPGNRFLMKLVDAAREGTVALPQFQRNFVWTRDDIADLLVSVLSGYFIGSFLILRSDPESIPFAIRAIEGVELSGHPLRAESLVLDGQQRLTAVHYALYAPDVPVRYTKYPYRFFLRLDEATAGKLDEAVFSVRSDSCGSLLEPETQFAERVLPFAEVPAWQAWQNRYEDWLMKQDATLDGFRAHRDQVKPRWDALMGPLATYQVPAITLPKIDAGDPDGLSRVCMVFEKLNTSGVRLSVFDLLTARLYAHGIDLHQLWQASMETFPLLKQFCGEDKNDYSVLVLRVVGLARGLEVKGKTLINLSPEGFEADWRAASGAMELALQRLVSTNDDGFGVIDLKWLPYSTVVPVMAAVLLRISGDHLGHEAYGLLRRWYWSAVFTERYGGAVESTSYKDYNELLKAFADPTFVPEALIHAQRQLVDGFSLLDIGRQNAMYKAAMCLIAKQGAKDFRTGDSIEFHELDDHHVFPQAFLRAQKRPDGQPLHSDAAVNAVVNRTLISSQTNRSISHSRPSDYLATVFPPDAQPRILATHGITAEAAEAMQADDFEAFCLARDAALTTLIRTLV